VPCSGLEHRHDHHGLRVARGSYLLHRDLPEAALIEFRQALAIRRDIEAFSGAVMACIACRKHHEALHHAKWATALLPSSASAACLLGLANLQQETAVPCVAEASLRRALELDPGHREAAAALVGMLQHKKDMDGAVDVLRAQIALHPDDALYVQLGGVYRLVFVALACKIMLASTGLCKGTQAPMERMQRHRSVFPSRSLNASAMLGGIG
jgi:tetratricopeptide (TPR) repeat protein